MSQPRRKAPTPEQRKRREEVDRRNEALQRQGVPFPHKTGGIFGGKPTEKKK